MKRFLSFAGAVLAAILAGCSDGDVGREFSTLEELENAHVRFGIEEGTFAERLGRERFKGCECMPTFGPIVLFPALEKGQIDAIVFDRPFLEYAAQAHPEFKLLDENLGLGQVVIGTKLGNTALMAQVNAFIRKIREDGTYRQIYDRWVHTPGARMPEIPEPEHPDSDLVIGICPEQEPMCFISHGELSGYDVEFSRRLALYLNRRPVLVSSSYDSLQAAVAAGKYELGIAQFDATPERRQSMLMSEPYIDTPIGVMVRRARTGRRSLVEFVRAGVHGTFLDESRWRMVASGLLVTLEITLLATILGTLLAFPVWLSISSRNPLVNAVGRGWVEVMQGTPVLVLLMVVFYIAFAQVSISPIIVAILVFAMNFSAYAGEMLKVGVSSVGTGQREAAFMLGYSRFKAFRRIVMPQVILRMLPVYRGQVIMLLKDTSVVGYITIHDLTKISDLIRARTYEAFFPLISTAVLYFLLAKVLELLLVRIGRRIDPARRRDRGGKAVNA